jgi:hypothetical protein
MLMLDRPFSAAADAGNASQKRPSCPEPGSPAANAASPVRRRCVFEAVSHLNNIARILISARPFSPKKNEKNALSHLLKGMGFHIRHADVPLHEKAMRPGQAGASRSV